MFPLKTMIFPLGGKILPQAFALNQGHTCIEYSLFWDVSIPILWSRLAWLASLDEFKHGGKDSDPILKLFQRPLLQFVSDMNKFAMPA